MIKKDDSCSSPSSMRQSHSEHLTNRSRENSISRQSSKTPVNLTSSTGDHREVNSSEVTTANSSNANLSSKMSSSSPISLSEKSNHQNDHVSSNGVSSNNNGIINQREQFTMNGPEKILPSPSTDRKEFEFSKVNGESKISTLKCLLVWSRHSLFRCLDNSPKRNETKTSN